MNLKPIEVVVVEDEPLVLEELVRGLEEDPLINVCGQAEDVDSAYELVVSHEPDAIFLDIKLIGGTGFDLLRRLKTEGRVLPPVVLNTGHERFEYALTAFNEFHDVVIHILQKPFFKNWEKKRRECLKAVAARKENRAETKLLAALGIFSVRNKNHTFFVTFDEIQYLEVGGSGTVHVIVKDGRKLHLNRTLTSLLQELPPYILQVSRYNAVNIQCISYIDHEKHELFLKGRKKGLPIGEGYYSNLLELLK
ncbi:MAG: response regulator transcription factor [Lewinellaceae bacterium]|nr:response regulator transcription factor [Lewinellaceae bacterium]